MNGDRSAGALRQSKKLVENVLWRRTAVWHKHIVMIDPGSRESRRVVRLLVQPNDRCYTVLDEIINVTLGRMISRSEFRAGTGEREKLLRQHPIKIAVSHLLVFLVLGEVEVVEVEETESCGFVNRVQTVCPCVKTIFAGFC